MKKIVIFSKTTDIPSQHCPHCNCEIVAATHLDGRESPECGSIFVCYQCCGVGVFTKTLSLRKLEQSEIDAMTLDEQNYLTEMVIQMQTALREMKKQA